LYNEYIIVMIMLGMSLIIWRSSLKLGGSPHSYQLQKL